MELGRDVFFLPPFSILFSVKSISDALEEHIGKVSKGGRIITNLRFADDIDAIAEGEQEQEIETLSESLEKTCKMDTL